jgi:hypothetical protein
VLGSNERKHAGGQIVTQRSTCPRRSIDTLHGASPFCASMLPMPKAITPHIVPHETPMKRL